MFHLPEGKRVWKSKFRWDILKNLCKIDASGRDIFIWRVEGGREDLRPSKIENVA